MPKYIHDKLKKEAEGKNLADERKDAYIYGVLNKIAKRKTKAMK